MTQAAGPYPETFVTLTTGRATGQPPAGSRAPGRWLPHGQVNASAESPDEWLAVAGRAALSGPLDDVALQAPAPAGLINGTTYRGGTQPPLQPFRVLAALPDAERPATLRT